MFKKKKYIRIIVIALVAIVVFLVIAKKKKWIGKEEIMSVSTEQVQKRSITEQVTANGKVQPVTEVKLSPDVSGEIIELYIKEGDKVQAGTLLAKINPDIYISNLNRTEATLNNTIASLAQAKARLAQTQAQYINNKLSFDRSEKLWNQQAISASDFDNAKATYEVSKAEVTAAEQAVISAEYNVKSIEASLKEAKDNLSKTSIYAPLDGTISKLNIEKGERVVGTSQFAGTEIMRISNLNEMEVKVEVNENDIIRVHLNDT
ncbi:MAG: biotin/lipoyl-binding protein, partial [Bacteroidales bacterium]|nr:biotin/lipoyl-binding protein [Bacteroidales bacterium]